VPDLRPNLSAALDRLLVDVVARVPDLSHVHPAGLLLVAAAAKDHSRATIRPLNLPGHPRVVVSGTPRALEIALRPLFFLDANGPGRLVTLFHELFHVDPHAPDRLGDARRHGGPGGRFNRHVEEMARAYAAAAPPRLLAPLGHHGEVLVRQWRVRPGPGVTPGLFGDEHLFWGPVPMLTPRRHRSGW
jgi:hypothetical protein